VPVMVTVAVTGSYKAAAPERSEPARLSGARGAPSISYMEGAPPLCIKY
jgi:hypothetical protein